MSLTSYRTAPSRVKTVSVRRSFTLKTQSPACRMAGAGRSHSRSRRIRSSSRPRAAVRCKGKTCLQEDAQQTGLCRPGSDLLSHALRRSTIGARGLNDGVRDGIRWGPPAITTGSAETSLRCETKNSQYQDHVAESLRFQLHMN